MGTRNLFKKNQTSYVSKRSFQRENNSRYYKSNTAIQGFTRSLCREVGKYGITVNCVAPGFIKSEMTDSMPPEIVEAGIRMIPIGRIGTAEDMGYAYLFLASKEAQFVNGITLHSNGGTYPI